MTVENERRGAFRAGYNRVCSWLEPETNLDHVEQVVDGILDGGAGRCRLRVGSCIARSANCWRKVAVAEFCEIGVSTTFRCLCQHFSDSELGIDFALNKMARVKSKRPLLEIRSVRRLRDVRRHDAGDEAHAGHLHGRRACRATGRSSLAYAELLARRGCMTPLKRYNYGLRICRSRCIGAD